MEAFHSGYEVLEKKDWEFLVKLDGDLSFESTYFESCLAGFKADPMLGIAGGTIWNTEDGALKLEVCPAFHVRGATKIYRRACWDSIGGLIRTPGWDTVDELKANMLGWHTRSFQNLRLVQHRPTGAADGSWRNSVKDGRADYISGYHPVFMLMKCMKRLARKPFFLGSLGLLYGFVAAYLNRFPRVNDPVLIEYVRTQQIRRLFLLDSLWK